MLFIELRFLYFLALALAVHWSLRGLRARKLWLLATSYAFYAAWDWRFLSLILLSTAVDYGVALRIAAAGSPAARRRWLQVSLVAGLGALAIFKYYDFFGESAAQLARWLGFPVSHTALQLVLPVGISFYTFQSLSYTVDVYRGTLRATRDFWDFALFIGFFPQLVAGPIVRAAYFLPQLAEPRRWSRIPVRACLMLFLVGFVKKASISDNLSPFVDAYFADPAAWSAHSAWVATLFYAAQIYCDFSGYSDMALGAAGLFGYRLPLNFDAPYFAADVAEFWRRWHISLSSWLRDYLYIPLGGNRGTRLFTTRNLLLTMLLGGLWHGAAWNFVIWGGLHGLALVVHREWRRRAGAAGQRGLPAALARLLTFYWVCVAWIFFRSETFGAALIACRSFVLLESPGPGSLGGPGLSAVVLLAAAHALARRPEISGWWKGLPPWAFGAVYGALFALAFACAPIAARPFIYFQF